MDNWKLELNCFMEDDPGLVMEHDRAQNSGRETETMDETTMELEQMTSPPPSDTFPTLLLYGDIGSLVLDPLFSPTENYLEEPVPLTGGESQTGGVEPEPIYGFEQFSQNPSMIAAAMTAAGIDAAPVEDTVPFPDVPMPVIINSRRRKASLASRNVKENPVPDFTFQDSEEAVEQKVKRQKKRPEGPRKMHELDPRAFPNVKGAVYSRMNREKKKAEYHEALQNVAKLEELNRHLRMRIQFRDGLLRPYIGEQGIQRLRFEDNSSQLQ